MHNVIQLPNACREDRNQIAAKAAQAISEPKMNDNIRLCGQQISEEDFKAKMRPVRRSDFPSIIGASDSRTGDDWHRARMIEAIKAFKDHHGTETTINELGELVEELAEQGKS